MSLQSKYLRWRQGLLVCNAKTPVSAYVLIAKTGLYWGKLTHPNPRHMTKLVL